MSDRSPKRVDWLRTRLGPSAGVALLLGAIGFGCFVGVKYLLKWWHYRQAEQALAANKLGESWTRWQAYLESWPRDGDAHYLAARAARRLREFKDAEEHLKKSKELGIDPEKLRLEWAMMQAQRESPVTVEGYLMTLVHAGHPDSAAILEALIQGYLKTYQIPQAHHCCDLWLERDPEAAGPYLWRGMVWEKLLNSKAAASDFQKVLAVEPDNPDARLHLADLLLGFKEYAEALEHYEWLYARQPDNLQIRLGLAGSRVGLSFLEEAQELLDQLIRDYPKNPLVLAECGKLNLRMGRPNEAEEALRRAIAVDPYEPEAVFAYTQALQAQDKFTEAQFWRDRHDHILADLNRLYELNTRIITAPRDPDLRHEIGVIFLRNGREKEGLGWLNTALEMSQGHRPTLQALAEYCEKHGMTREAAQYREQAGLKP